jgi:hypothetical protein
MLGLAKMEAEAQGDNMARLKVGSQADGPTEWLGRVETGRLEKLTTEVDMYFEKTVVPLYKEMRFQDFLGRALRQFDTFSR